MAVRDSARAVTYSWKLGTHSEFLIRLGEDSQYPTQFRQIPGGYLTFKDWPEAFVFLTAYMGEFQKQNRIPDYHKSSGIARLEGLRVLNAFKVVRSTVLRGHSLSSSTPKERRISDRAALIDHFTQAVAEACSAELRESAEKELAILVRAQKSEETKTRNKVTRAELRGLDAFVPELDGLLTRYRSAVKRNNLEIPLPVYAAGSYLAASGSYKVVPVAKNSPPSFAIEETKIAVLRICPNHDGPYRMYMVTVTAPTGYRVAEHAVEFTAISWSTSWRKGAIDRALKFHLVKPPYKQA